MARPRIDAAIAALARRRADLASAHFGLAYSIGNTMPAAATARSPEGHAQPSAGFRPRLAISVPKRQLRRAVDRNMMKRVAREAWRLADWAQARRCPSGLQAMLKLRRVEPEWKAMGRNTLKKAWRAEIDALLQQLHKRLVPSSPQVDR